MINIFMVHIVLPFDIYLYFLIYKVWLLSRAYNLYSFFLILIGQFRVP